MDQKRTFPIKPGDWVMSRYQDGRVAKVRSVYADSNPNETIFDAYYYDHVGTRVGRVSPTLGGPRKFEPALEFKDWFRIDEPAFPTTLRWVPNERGGVTARHAVISSKTGRLAEPLPDRQWSPPTRKPRALPPRGPSNALDVEIAALRRAAQELRDLASNKPGEAYAEMRERAKQLEAEAEALAKPL